MRWKEQFKWNLQSMRIIHDKAATKMKFTLESRSGKLSEICAGSINENKIWNEVCDTNSNWKIEIHVWKSQVRLKFATEMTSTMIRNQICSVSSNWSEISDTSREWNEICDRNTKQNKSSTGAAAKMMCNANRDCT